VDELVPARLRGRVDLIINGSFWLGTMFGAALSLLLLDKNLFAPDLGWRLGVTGPALFGKLVETGKEVNVFYGYLIGAALMIVVGAAGKSLEDVAKPLTAHDEEAEATA
jgi:hypothetical protein